MDARQLQQLLERVKSGNINIEEAVQQIRRLPFEDVDFAKIDHHRQLRCAFAEVIYCPGKTTDQIKEIFSKLAAKGNNVLATRAEQKVFDDLEKTKKYKDLRYEKQAGMVVLEQKPLQKSKGLILIVTAGTADVPVASEAKVTAEIMGQRAEMICDVGVAGLHRLLGHLEILQKANVVIVVAGMEGALASVVGGLVSCPAIAVPTSVGYGASFEGLSALLTMLNSCAAGVTVVNIDNGFGAGFTASLMNRRMTQKDA